MPKLGNPQPTTAMRFIANTSDRAIETGVMKRFSETGSHTARTIMLAELTAVLAAVPPTARRPDISKPLSSETALENQRLHPEKDAQYLTEVYGLDPEVATFRVLRRSGTLTRHHNRSLACWPLWFAIACCW